ncbi:hypothetical protein [Spiroplasma alleghenense]|uniref:Uncharacterized protein n=1 Tax=Spiroplasma alleghenense TaxID=216931 RepID=A0A345Z549_9MOLU|nr:hypothetical protein [Spiroplasma alleghenense]AXK51728.1 hypothetical protein SALLE_v1c10580 [Spiroplasma alleghenense]
MFLKKDFDYINYKTKHKIVEELIKKLLKNIADFWYKERLSKKIVLVFEESNAGNEKEILSTFNNLINKNEKYKLIFKKLLFNKKENKSGQPIAVNEIVDFVNYSLWLWASLKEYHFSKFSLYSYPNHEKKTLSIIDKINRKL